MPIFTADFSAALERSGRSFHAVPGPAAAAIQTSVCCARSEVAPPLAGACWLKGRDIRKAPGGVTAEFRGGREMGLRGAYRIGRRPVKLPEFGAGNRARRAPGPGHERLLSCVRLPHVDFASKGLHRLRMGDQRILDGPRDRRTSMPKATTCDLNGRRIDIDVAVQLRDDARRLRQPDPDFRCLNCGGVVRPERAGGRQAAHFEHQPGNPNCRLGHYA